MKTVLLAAALLGTVPLALAVGVVEVVQAQRAFASRKLSVPAGTVLRFLNQDDFPHQISVTGPGLDYDSDLQAPGIPLTVTLSRAGLFEVRCGVHPRMQLTVEATRP